MFDKLFEKTYQMVDGKFYKWKVKLSYRPTIKSEVREIYTVVTASNEDMAWEKVKRAYGPTAHLISMDKIQTK